MISKAEIGFLLIITLLLFALVSWLIYLVVSSRKGEVLSMNEEKKDDVKEPDEIISLPELLDKKPEFKAPAFIERPDGQTGIVRSGIKTFVKTKKDEHYKKQLQSETEVIKSETEVIKASGERGRVVAEQYKESLLLKAELDRLPLEDKVKRAELELRLKQIQKQMADLEAPPPAPPPKETLDDKIEKLRKDMQENARFAAAQAAKGLYSIMELKKERQRRISEIQANTTLSEQDKQEQIEDITDFFQALIDRYDIR